jgi:hypothetical protein
MLRTYENMQSMCHVLDFAWALVAVGENSASVEISSESSLDNYGTIKIFSDGTCQLAYDVTPGHPSEVLCALLNIANR